MGYDDDKKTDATFPRHVRLDCKIQGVSYSRLLRIVIMFWVSMVALKSHTIDFSDRYDPIGVSHSHEGFNW